MKFLICNNISEAEIINNRITNDLIPEWNDGITDKYCVPFLHPTDGRAAIPIEQRYIDKFSQEEINNSQELTQDWFPVEEL